MNTTFGTALTAAVGATANAYVGLESTVNAADIGGGAAMVGSVAKLLYGTPGEAKTAQHGLAHPDHRRGAPAPI